MRRYDDEKSYKSVPNVPKSLDEYEANFWRTVCKKKLATEEGLKASDLDDILNLVVKTNAVADIAADLRTYGRPRMLTLAISAGKLAQQVRDCKQRLFGDPDVYIE